MHSFPLIFLRPLENLNVSLFKKFMCQHIQGEVICSLTQLKKSIENNRGCQNESQLPQIEESDMYLKGQ